MPIETHDVMIVGSGGREDAIGWKLRQSPHVRNIYFAAPKNNAGTARWGENIGIDIGNARQLASNIRDIIEFVQSKRIGLTVVGPEAPLLAGIVNQFFDRDLPTDGMQIFGPTKEAAQIEGSKAWAVRFFRDYDVPHAASEIFDKQTIRLAHHYADEVHEPLVYKADGQALGKGVFLPLTKDEEHDVIDRLLEKEELGEAGTTIVVQEKLEGPEASIQAICDGRIPVMLKTSTDYKRAFDDDKGPNTGGMGAYTPDLSLSRSMNERIRWNIVLPILKGMAREGRPFMGALYPGVIIDSNRPKVLEVNARFGDPETQVIMQMMKSDLFPLLYGAATGDLSGMRATFRKGASVCVVLASGGYPGDYQKGVPIHGLEEFEETKNLQVFMAGVARNDNAELVTNGGRVLGVTAHGPTHYDAQNLAYRSIGPNLVREGVHFDEMHYRSDIAQKAIDPALY